jgi:hypothetical protein
MAGACGFARRRASERQVLHVDPFCGRGGLSFGLFLNQPYHLALPLPPY